MLLVEGTFWPLVVVGVVPGSGTSDVLMTIDEKRLWSSDVLRLAFVVSGVGVKTKATQRELFRWMYRYKKHLWRRTQRIAFVIEDDTVRACAELWLDLVRDRLCRGEVHVFPKLKPALTWLAKLSPDADASGVQEEVS